MPPVAPLITVAVKTWLLLVVMPPTTTGRQPAASPTAKVRLTAVALFTVMPNGPFTYEVAEPVGMVAAAVPSVSTLPAEVVRTPLLSVREPVDTPLAFTSRLPPASTTPSGLLMDTASTMRVAGISKPVVRAVASGA